MVNLGVYSSHLPTVILSLLFVFTFRAVAFGVTALIWTRTSTWAQQNQIYTKENIPLKWSLDFFPAVTVLLLDSAVVGFAIWVGFFRITRDVSVLASVFAFLAYFVWFEIYFYYTHKWMHHPKLFWIHRLHHERRATNAMTSLMFSIPERLVLLFGAIFIPGLLSQAVILPAAGVLYYFLYNYIMNVYGHLNVELIPKRWIQGRYGQVMATTISHSKHHQVFRGNYGLFTQILDRFHKTQIH